MAYCDNLYNIGNIIGYTGDLYDFPTVYFKCDRQDIAGHITQKHHRPQNIGRQEPMPLGGIPYTIRNVVNRDGELVAKEYYGNYAFHTSRSSFKPIGTTVRHGGGQIIDMHVVNILMQALRRCPDEKQMSAIGDREEAKLDEVIAKKNSVMDQLKQFSTMAKRGHGAMQRRGLA